MDKKYLAIKTAEDASTLTGLAFEEYLTQLFAVLGFTTKQTKASGDYGGDVLVEGRGKRIVFQAKQYSGQVGFSAVKEAFFAKSFYNTDEAWVITTSSFTQQAISGAARVGVKLVSGTELTAYIEEAHRVLDGYKPKVSRVRKKGGANRGRNKSDFTISNLEEGFEGKDVLLQYRGSSPYIRIPDGIEVLGKGAFVGGTTKVPSNHARLLAESFGLKRPFCKSEVLDTVVLPEGLISIEDSCFRGCHNLQDINIPNSVTRIGDRAFQETGLMAVSLSNTICYGEYTFYHCDKLCTVTIEDGIEEIPVGCFSSCGLLESIDLPTTIRIIRKRAFDECIGLTSLVVPEGVEIIEPYAFADCSSLEEIILPESLRVLAVNAFSGCPALRNAFIGDVFDLSGVRLIVDDPGDLFKRNSEPIELSESEARADFEFDEWAREYCSTHKQSPMVSDIERIEMDASSIQACREILSSSDSELADVKRQLFELRYSCAPLDVVSVYETIATLEEREQTLEIGINLARKWVEGWTARLADDLKAMGLRDDLFPRFLERKNIWCNVMSERTRESFDEAIAKELRAARSTSEEHLSSRK